MPVPHPPSPTRVYRDGHVELASFFQFKSDCMKRLLSDIAPVVHTDLPILLFGEPGVGKNFLAQGIKNASPRKNGPFVCVNTTDHDPSLLRSEWFGHVKGAFTGADQNHIGKFASAHKGTLFLDEILELPVHEQTRILQAIELHLVTPVGGTKPTELDCRPIYASNRPLEEVLSDRGRWRIDFLSRLGSAWFTVPPLRDRLEDLPSLVEAFVFDAATAFGRDVSPNVPDRTLRAIAERPWYANLRELRSVLQVGVARCQGDDLLPEHLPRGLDARPDRASIQALEPHVFHYVRRAIDACDGNKSEAARLLDISRDALYRVLGESEASSTTPNA